jgi:hypothetical protein
LVTWLSSSSLFEKNVLRRLSVVSNEIRFLSQKIHFWTLDVIREINPMQINLKKIIYSLKDLLGSAHNHPDLSLGLLGPNERGQGFLLALDLLRSVKNLTRPDTSLVFNPLICG